MDDGVQAFMRAMNEGFPAVETMTAAGGAGSDRRPPRSPSPTSTTWRAPTTA